MKTKKLPALETTVAARVVGEDIRIDDFVTVLSHTTEWPTFMWDHLDMAFPIDEPVRIRTLPCQAGQPFKVVAICLPFVYVEPALGDITVFDTRLQELVRLDEQSGKAVWKRLRKKSKSKKTK